MLLEGDAGVGKTEVAKALAAVNGARLIRLQCYEGLDVHAAMYEWNYQRQLLAIKLLEHDDRPVAAKEQDIFSERYLLKRPLLEAISCESPPVLLIDEIDRADEAFEAYLLELLSDFQMSIPELGTVRAVSRPLVVITSNGTRELSDALRRRCLYQYIDYPAFEKELAIVELRVPEAAGALARQLVAFVQEARRMELRKKPGIAETLDWTAALLAHGHHHPRRRRGRAHPRVPLGAHKDPRRSRRFHPRGRGPHRRRMLIVAPSPAQDPRALLRSRLAGFPGFLHANGYGVGGGDSADVLETAQTRGCARSAGSCAGASSPCSAGAATNGAGSTRSSMLTSCRRTGRSSSRVRPAPCMRRRADRAMPMAMPCPARHGGCRRRYGRDRAPRGEPRGIPRPPRISASSTAATTSATSRRSCAASRGA